MSPRAMPLKNTGHPKVSTASASCCMARCAWPAGSPWAGSARKFMAWEPMTMTGRSAHSSSLAVRRMSRADSCQQRQATKQREADGMERTEGDLTGKGVKSWFTKASTNSLRRAWVRNRRCTNGSCLVGFRNTGASGRWDTMAAR